MLNFDRGCLPFAMSLINLPSSHTSISARIPPIACNCANDPLSMKIFQLHWNTAFHRTLQQTRSFATTFTLPQVYYRAFTQKRIPKTFHQQQASCRCSDKNHFILSAAFMHKPEIYIAKCSQTYTEIVAGNRAKYIVQNAVGQFQ